MSRAITALSIRSLGVHECLTSSGRVLLKFDGGSLFLRLTLVFLTPSLLHLPPDALLERESKHPSRVTGANDRRFIFFAALRRLPKPARQHSPRAVPTFLPR